MEVELSDVHNQYADLKVLYDELFSKGANMVMDLAIFYGQRARLELFET